MVLSTLPRCGVCVVVYAVQMGSKAGPVGSDPTEVVVAFERAHGQALFGFARRLDVSDAHAADVVQEALLRLFDALSHREAIRDTRAWTFHVAYRLAMDDHRRTTRNLKLVDRLRPNPAVLSDASDDIASREVWAEVDRLPERQRAVLYLRYRADLDFDAVGAVLSITASAARSHCTQALGRLRTALAGEAIEEATT